MMQEQSQQSVSESSYRVPKILAQAFVCFSVLLLLANLQLIRKVSQEEQAYDAATASAAPQPGMTVPALSGYDVDGRPVRLEYGPNQPKTLILAMSPSCHACEDNWKHWQQLAQSNPEKVGRIVLADIATNEPPLSKEFVEEHRLQGATVLAQVNAESIEGYRFQYTPQTILVTGSGKIEAVQTGSIAQGRFAPVAFLEQTLRR